MDDKLFKELLDSTEQAIHIVKKDNPAARNRLYFGKELIEEKKEGKEQTLPRHN